VEISLQIDEANACIKDIQIASDCLEPEAIQRAETLLRGYSTHEMPPYDQNDEILSDIVHLIYG